MTHCFICGETKNLKFRKDLFKIICRFCSLTTPRKVSRESFDKRYWGETLADSQIPESTKREFYSDYLASTNNLEAYINTTTTIE